MSFRLHDREISGPIRIDIPREQIIESELSGINHQSATRAPSPHGNSFLRDDQKSDSLKNANLAMIKKRRKQLVFYQPDQPHKLKAIRS